MTVADKIGTAVRSPDKILPYFYNKVWGLFGERPKFYYSGVGAADTLDELAEEVYVDASLFHQVTADYEGPRSLEVGCGFGKMTPWIASRTDEHHIVEKEQELIDVTSERYPEVSFDQSTASDIPYEDDYFDLIVFWGVLMHVPPEFIEDAASEVHRVLADDGVVAAAEVVSGEAKEASWIRSIDEYDNLFSELELVTVEKRDQPSFDESDRENYAMRFEA